MGRYSIGARIWVGFTGVAALVLALQYLRSAVLAVDSLVAFAVLALCGAIAHGFPIRSIFDGASIRITNVFLLAGAVILPPWLVALLPVAAITPDTLLRRRNPGAAMRWCFNVSQTVIAAFAAWAWVRWGEAHLTGDLAYLGVTAGAALLFSAVQAGMVGIIIALNSKIPLHRADTFTLPHLQSSVLVTMLGSLVGGLWMAKPALLVLVLPLVVLAYYLSRSAHLAYLAQVDVKTGLHNYRHFEQMLDEELGRTHRQGRPLSIIFCDLDYLRDVNNTYGHQAGVKVLQGIAQILTSTMRKGDVIARFGGEEFVALLPGTDAEETAHVAEQVRIAVANHPFEIEPGRTIACTISIGIAACPEDSTDVAGLIKQADLAMYRAKQTRNAVCRVRVLPPVPRITVAQASNGKKGAEKAAGPQKHPLAGFTLWAIVGAGFFVALGSAYLLTVTSTWLLALPLMALALAVEFVKERVFEAKQEQITMSFGIAVTMAAVAINPPGAVLASLTAAAVHVLFIQKQRNPEKLCFNLANPMLAAAAAAGVFTLVNPGGDALSLFYLSGALAAVFAFHLVNFGLINLMISLHTRRPFLSLVTASAWYSPTKIFLGLTGAFLGGVYSLLGAVGVVMFLVPLIILRYSVGLYAKQSETTIAQLKAAKAEVEQAHLQKEETLRQLIKTVAHIIDARDHAVSGHSGRVAKYALALAQEMGLTPAELATVQTVSLLHDMGKIAVPEEILNKPSRLTPEEYTIVKEHASVGERILSAVGPLEEVARMVGEHHERWDGKGYPRGKMAGEISVGGRIICVADTLDTILSDRPYSKNRGLDWAMNELRECAGAQFDPEVVAALQRIVKARGPEFFDQPTRPVEVDRLAGLVS